MFGRTLLSKWDRSLNLTWATTQFITLVSFAEVNVKLPSNSQKTTGFIFGFHMDKSTIKMEIGTTITQKIYNSFAILAINDSMNWESFNVGQIKLEGKL
jgi:hypothetical protein